ncbi:hypothetical protein EUGRSUZ_H03318 [Eucalyptus grandis]|uniref:Uncharacterized protein n=2 Tax=Eucalyptus grandis TaxID=71139 RepID=A0ACC3JWV3_EUCGR|nr:hypothetical protein EUGRSUZ_H03318 [Eucalyptus grandis]
MTLPVSVLSSPYVIPRSKKQEIARKKTKSNFRHIFSRFGTTANSHNGKSKGKMLLLGPANLSETHEKKRKKAGGGGGWGGEIIE